MEAKILKRENDFSVITVLPQPSNFHQNQKGYWPAQCVHIIITDQN